MTKFNKAKTIALWNFTTILAALLLFVGILKLTGAEKLVVSFLPLIGICQIKTLYIYSQRQYVKCSVKKSDRIRYPSKF